MPQQSSNQFGLLVAADKTAPLSVAAFLGNGGKLDAGAPLHEILVGSPMILHVCAQVLRHTVEQALSRIQLTAIALTEGERGEQNVQLIQFVIAQRRDGFIDRYVNVMERKLSPCGSSASMVIPSLRA